MASPHGLACLISDWSAYRWALDHVFGCLVPVDGMRLLISILEHGDYRYREFTHWVMDGDTPSVNHDDAKCLFEAAKFGCWVAADLLNLRMNRRGLVDHKLRHPPHFDTALRREMAMATINEYRYQSRRDVMVPLATRGDLAAVACMVLDESKSRYSHQEAVTDAFQAASDARQYHVVEWIATHARDCRRCDRRGSQTVESQIARNGDLGVLQDRYASGDASTWELSSMIEQAAAGGHVPVVEWILQTFQLAIKPEWFLPAAECGQLEMLQWLWAHLDMRKTPVNFLVPATQHRHLKVLQWLKQNLGKATWMKHRPTAVWEAREALDLETIVFLDDGDSALLEIQWWYHITDSTSVDTIDTCLSLMNLPHVDQGRLLEVAAERSNLDVVKYLVLQRGYWSRLAFRGAVSTRSRGVLGLHVGQFLYAHAKRRARELHTSLEAHIDFSGIGILPITSGGYSGTARWLAECVPEVDMGALESSCYVMGRFPVTTDAQRTILACLRTRPTQCLRIGWLPHWSCSANNFEAFSALVDMDHPDAIRLCIGRTDREMLRDARFMLKILAVEGLEIEKFTHVVPWVGRLGAERVLNVIYRRWGDRVCSMERRSLEEAAREAVQHGHVGMLVWFHNRELLVPKSEEHKDRVLARNSVVAKLILHAAKHDRVECLVWLVETFGATSCTLGEALRAGVAYYCGRVVRWLLCKSRAMTCVERRFLKSTVGEMAYRTPFRLRTSHTYRQSVHLT